MKNLIICSNSNETSINDIVTALDKNNFPYEFYYYEENNLSFDELTILVKKSSHFTFIYKKEALEVGNFKYILGFLTTLRRKILVYNSENEIDLSFIRNKINFCNNSSKLEKIYYISKRIYLKERRIKLARRELNKLDLCISTRGFFDIVDQGLPEVLKLYLHAGFDPDTKKDTGLSILSLACRKGHRELVEMLIKAGANINLISDDRGNTPIMDAASEGFDEILDILLKEKPDLNISSKSGQTAVILAIGAKKTSAAVKLIKAGADITIKDALGMDAKKYATLFKIEEVLDIIA